MEKILILSSISWFGSFMLVLVGLYLSWFLFKWLTNPLYKIPGPFSLPLIGSLIPIDSKRPHITFAEFAQKYGDIMQVQMYNRVWVVVNSYDLCYEALVKRPDEFCGRPSSIRKQAAFGQNVVFANGESHTKRKKLFMASMRNYGTGLDEMESVLSEAIQRFVAHLESKDGQTVDIAKQFSLFAYNVIYALLYGVDLSFDDPRLEDMWKYNRYIVEFISPAKNNPELDSFPWLIKVPFLGNFYRKRLERIKELGHSLLEDKIKEAIDEYERGNTERRGLLAEFVKAMKTRTGSNGEAIISEEELKGLVTDTLAAGSETTRKTITHIFLELCKQSELVKGLRSEIDTVIGKDRPPRLSDRNDMPFTEAVIQEGNRILSLLPLSFHQTPANTKLGGYYLPKDTEVAINYWVVHHDEKRYPDPFHFDPYRFLNVDGTKVSFNKDPDQRILAFGAGRRICAGEIFAKSRLFLLLVSLYQKLDLTLASTNINSDVRSYVNKATLDVPESVLVKVKCWN